MLARSSFEMVWTPLPSVIAGVYFAVAEKARHLSEPVQEIVDVFSSEIEANFEAEGRPTQWEALTESTEKQKGGGGKILQRTGDLKAKATSPESWSISPSSGGVVAVLDDPTGYGVFHVTGTPFMPQRDWTYISDEALDEAEEILADWVTEPWVQ